MRWRAIALVDGDPKRMRCEILNLRADEDVGVLSWKEDRPHQKFLATPKNLICLSQWYETVFSFLCQQSLTNWSPPRDVRSWFFSVWRAVRTIFASPCVRHPTFPGRGPWLLRILPLYCFIVVLPWKVVDEETIGIIGSFFCPREGLRWMKCWLSWG